MEGPQVTEQKKRRLLVLDGGGMRGLASVQALKKLQQAAGLTIDDFDMICGTSAGGLISLATLLGLSLDEIEALFIKIGKEIFTSSWTNTARYVGRTGVRNSSLIT
jgi:patatin-like phospholipase/acyl hydrolase